MKRLKELGARRRSVELPKQSSEPQAPRLKEISQVEEVENSRFVNRRMSVDGVVRIEKLLGEYQQALSVPGNLRGSLASRRSSFSSSSEIPSSSSSRLSDASSVNNYSSAAETTVPTRRSNHKARTVVVAFDANARDALVGAIAWTFWTSLHGGDVLLLLGVMDFIRGPLGYKCMVNDQTWLGANKKLLQDEIALKKLAWSSMPELKTLCDEREVRLVVEIQPAQRPEVAVAEAVSAAHVILDKSLHISNRQRKYYLQHLSCEVTRMRRSGGVEVIRAAPKEAPASPTSVIPPPPGPPPLLRDDDEELFTINHYRGRASIDEGYESDDLFSINGDAGWRSSSYRGRSSSVGAHDHDPDSSSRLDNRLLSLTRLQLGN